MNLTRMREALQKAAEYDNEDLPEDLSELQVDDDEDVVRYWPLVDAETQKILLRRFREEVSECNDFSDLERTYTDARSIPQLKEIILERITSFLESVQKLNSLIGAWNYEDFENDNEAHALLKKRIRKLIEAEDDAGILKNALGEINEPEALEEIYLQDDDILLCQVIANRLAKLLKAQVDQMTNTADVLDLYGQYHDRHCEEDPEKILDWVFLTKARQLIAKSTDPISLMELHDSVNEDYGLEDFILDRVRTLIRELPDNTYPPQWFVDLADDISVHEEEIGVDLIIKSRAILLHAN